MWLGHLKFRLRRAELILQGAWVREMCCLKRVLHLWQGLLALLWSFQQIVSCAGLRLKSRLELVADKLGGSSLDLLKFRWQV